MPTCQPAGICIRLRDTISKLFPDNVTTRREEAAQQDEHAHYHAPAHTCSSAAQHAVPATTAPPWAAAVPQSSAAPPQQQRDQQWLAGVRHSIELLLQPSSAHLPTASFGAQSAPPPPGLAAGVRGPDALLPMPSDTTTAALGSPAAPALLAQLDILVQAVNSGLAVQREQLLQYEQVLLGVLCNPWLLQQSWPAGGAAAPPASAQPPPPPPPAVVVAPPYSTSSLQQASRITSAQMGALQRQFRQVQRQHAQQQHQHQYRRSGAGHSQQAHQLLHHTQHGEGGYHQGGRAGAPDLQATAQQYMAQQLVLQRSAQELERQLAGPQVSAAAATWHAQQQQLHGAQQAQLPLLSAQRAAAAATAPPP